MRLKTESETGERLAPFARVRLLRQALPFSLLILRKKPTVLQSKCKDSQVQSYPYKHIRNVGWISTDALTQVNFNHVNKLEVRYKVLRLNVKLSEFLLLRLHNCKCGLSYIVFILFANANFMHVRT